MIIAKRKNKDESVETEGGQTSPKEGRKSSLSFELSES